MRTSDDSTNGLDEALEKHLLLVHERLADLREAIGSDCAGGAVFAAANLHLAWNLLELRLDVMAEGQDESARGKLRSHPAMCAIGAAVRDVLSVAANYAARRTDAASGEWPRLRQLLEDPTADSHAIGCQVERAFGVECACAVTTTPTPPQAGGWPSRTERDGYR